MNKLTLTSQQLSSESLWEITIALCRPCDNVCYLEALYGLNLSDLTGMASDHISQILIGKLKFSDALLLFILSWLRFSDNV